MKKKLNILIYYHIPEYVDRYENLIKRARKDLNLLTCKSVDQVIKVIRDAEIIFSGGSFPVDCLIKAKKLKWIQSMSAGVESFTGFQTLPIDVILTKPKKIFGVYMSEYVLGHVLALTQKIRVVYKNQQNKAWKPFITEVLRNKVIGIMGLGSVGLQIAYMFHLLGVEVIGLDEQERSIPYISREYGIEDRHEFLKNSDFVVLTLPLTDQTTGLLGKPEFASMKKTAILINVSRGLLVQEDDLIAALRKKRIAGAVLDVFKEEPLPKDHPFWNMENVIITPHVSGPSLPEDLTNIFLDNLGRFEKGAKLLGVVDLKKGY